MEKYRLNKNGYLEYNYTNKHENIVKGDLVHRHVAYEQIYMPNKSQYELPFRAYVVHHIDEDKFNNDPTNLQIMTKEDHEQLHRTMRHEGFTMDESEEVSIEPEHYYKPAYKPKKKKYGLKWKKGSSIGKAVHVAGWINQEKGFSFGNLFKWIINPFNLIRLIVFSLFLFVLIFLFIEIIKYYDSTVFFILLIIARIMLFLLEKYNSGIKKIFNFIQQKHRIIRIVTTVLLLFIAYIALGTVILVGITYVDKVTHPTDNQTNDAPENNQTTVQTPEPISEPPPKPVSINAEAFVDPLGYLQTTGLPNQTNQCFSQDCIDTAVTSCDVGTIFIMEGKTSYGSNLYDTKVYEMIYARKDSSCLVYQQIHNLTVGGDVMLKQVFLFINGKPQGDPIKFASQLTPVPNQPESFPKQ